MLFFKLLVRVEQLLLNRQQHYRDHLDELDVSEIVKGQIQIAPIVSKSGYFYRFDATAIEEVKKLNLDLLIRCGSGVLQGEILKVTRLGIISIHHGDSDIYRGGPAGFWEVYNKQDITGFTIQRLTEEPDGGDVLMRGHLQTKPYYLLNQAVLMERANYYVKGLIANIASDGSLPDVIAGIPYSSQLFRHPTAHQVTVYLFRLVCQILGKRLTRMCGFDYCWHVGYVPGDWRNAVLRRFIEISNPRSHFLADPFVIGKDDQSFCFVEDFDYRAKKGKIAVYELRPDGAARVGTALEDVDHLSFPYLFEYQNELFLCPETEAKREIRLYRCVEFPLRWKLEKVLIEDISAADTMIFENNGRWWLFTNTDPVGVRDYCTELSIFYSECPFGPWKPHRKNPIFVDASRARNAGLVKDGKSYFRVSQSQGFNVYGKKTLINKIVDLSEMNYSEQTIAVVTSAYAKRAVGTHHMHANARYTVFDFATRSPTN